ncbi:hypothetical protein V8J36_16290 [Frigidibacter sp. MR17.14]|uniref:hypothetical protein n=1 Tax=Frigidibacter sp. MR17.14 TaxID=3126509 RepID=UPI003013164E
MRRLTLALHLVMMLLILPWGAYGQHHAGVTARPAASAAVVEAAPQARRCHGPALPGLPCGLFLPPETTELPAPRVRGTRAFAAAAPLPSGTAVTPPRRPPRTA